MKAAPPVDRNGSSSTALRRRRRPPEAPPPRTHAPSPRRSSAPRVPRRPHRPGARRPDRASAATVDFGGLAAANGARPVLVPPAPGSTSYHLQQRLLPRRRSRACLLGGGTLTSPSWNPPSAVTCGACHALPGGSIDTSAWHPAVAVGADCGLCHAGYTRETVNVAVHVNGLPDVRAPDLVTSCTACHGDANRVVPAGSPPELLAAPPVDRHGSSDTRQVGVGAHQAHLLPGAERHRRTHRLHRVPRRAGEPPPRRPGARQRGVARVGNAGLGERRHPGLRFRDRHLHQLLPRADAATGRRKHHAAPVDQGGRHAGRLRDLPRLSAQGSAHNLHATSSGLALACTQCHPTRVHPEFGRP